jgi:hypothetical protein
MDLNPSDLQRPEQEPVDRRLDRKPGHAERKADRERAVPPNRVQPPRRPPNARQELRRQGHPASRQRDHEKCGRTVYGLPVAVPAGPGLG